MKNVGTSRDMLMGLRESLAQIKNTKWFFKNLLSTRNHFKSEIIFKKNLSTNYNKLKLTSKRYSQILSILILLHSKSNKKNINIKK
jgi:hypothetical protein